jgi:hypothetical protein
MIPSKKSPPWKNKKYKTGNNKINNENNNKKYKISNKNLSIIETYNPSFKHSNQTKLKSI